MKKLSAVLTLSTMALAMQASAATYSVTGSAQGISVDAGLTTTVTYTSPSANPPLVGTWDVDQLTADISGNVYLGDYVSHTLVSGGFLGNMTGDNTFFDVNQDLTAGTGSWVGTTFTYSIASGGANSGSASTHTYDAGSSFCSGSGNILGNTVCGTQAGTTGAWEGITITLNFSGDYSSFTGTIAAIEESGSGLTHNVTTINYDVAGVAEVSEVPVPAAAWLFGSALVGLAGVGRKRK